MPERIIVVCECQAKYSVHPKHVGKKATCPRCQRVLTVSPAPVSSTLPPAGPASQPLALGPFRWIRSPWLVASGGLVAGVCLAEGWDWMQSVSHASDHPLAQSLPTDNPPGFPPAKPSISVYPQPAVPVPAPDILPSKKFEDISLDVAERPAEPIEQQPSPPAAEPDLPMLPISDGPIADTFDEAKQLSLTNDRPILLLFFSNNCGWCQKLRSETLSHPTARQATAKAIVLLVDVNDRATHPLQLRYGVKGYPTCVLTDHSGEVIRFQAGFQQAQAFANWLDHPDVWKALRAAAAVPEQTVETADESKPPANPPAKTIRKRPAKTAKPRTSSNRSTK